MMKILLGLTVALATISGNVVAENVSTEVKTLVEALQSSTATSGRTILTGSAFSSQVAPHMAAFTALHAEVKAGRVKVADITAIAEKYQFSASQTLQIVGELRSKGQAVTAQNVEGLKSYQAMTARLRSAQAVASAPQARTSTDSSNRDAAISGYFSGDAASIVASKQDSLDTNDIQMVAAAGSIAKAAQKACTGVTDTACPTKVQAAANTYVAKVLPGLAAEGISPDQSAKLAVGVFNGSLSSEEISQEALVSGFDNIMTKVGAMATVSTTELSPVVGKQLAEQCFTGKSPELLSLAL